MAAADKQQTGQVTAAPAVVTPPEVPSIERLHPPSQLPPHANDYIGVLNTASSAVSTTATVASYAITGFALILTLIAVFGWFSIQRAIKSMAERALKRYIESEQFKNKIDAAVANAAQERMAGSVLVVSAGTQPIAPQPPKGGTT